MYTEKLPRKFRKKNTFEQLKEAIKILEARKDIVSKSQLEIDKKILSLLDGSRLKEIIKEESFKISGLKSKL
ncbi:hypothetical protein ES703_96908 [subsurface metagenome]